MKSYGQNYGQNLLWRVNTRGTCTREHRFSTKQISFDSKNVSAALRKQNWSAKNELYNKKKGKMGIYSTSSG
jgi:hypothetical protein